MGKIFRLAEQGQRGVLGVSQVPHLSAHPGEEQCALDEGKCGRGCLHH
jgi:hypothetical protein